MADSDGAARGRDAALRVRKSKRARRRAKVRKRYPALSIPAITEEFRGSEFECSQATIANDVKELGISAPVGPRRKYPKPEPRQCLNRDDPECPHHERDGWFTPGDASQVARGDGWCCSRLCARRSPAGRDVGRKAATERHQRADEKLADLNAAGYRSTRQAAHELGIAESSLYEILEPVERRLVEGEHLRLVRSHDVKALARERLASPWVAHYDDPANYVVHAVKLGVPPERARRLHAEREEARRRHRRIRIGTGRPKGTGPPSYHHEWAEAFRRIEAELWEGYDVYHVDGDPPPTKWGVAHLVALADYDNHPERWSYSPEEYRRAAADRVRAAVKALEIAPSGTRLS